MLQEQKTLDQMGYLPTNLAVKSNKTIIVSCDYCGSEYKMSKKSRTLSNKEVAKDACKECKNLKRKDICLKKYGVEHTSKLDSTKTKLSIANGERLKSNEFKEKTRKTMLKKYGVESPLQNEDLKNKYKKTNIDRYGVDNVSKLSNVIEKRKNTNLHRYGGEYIATDEGRKRITETILKKYGVKNVFSNETIKEKIRQTKIKKYGVDHHSKVPEIAKKCGQNSLISQIKSGRLTTHNGRTLPEIAQNIGWSHSRFHTLVKKVGLDKAMLMKPNSSSLEQKFEMWLKEQNIKYRKQVNIGGKFADFVVDNIAVELDGLYWHSDKHLNKTYHLQKRDIYINNNYIPLFFREDEINDKFHIVQSILNNKLNKSSKIYARKCQIVDVPKKVSKQFFNDNHLMGNGRGDCFGLVYNDRLVCCLLMVKKSDGIYEVSRFCNILNTSVIGGMSRLIQHFKTTYCPQKIFTFIDLRYGSGEYLANLGFKYVRQDLSFKWTDGNKTIHRLNFPGNSGYEYGLYKIWDCGQAKWECII